MHGLGKIINGLVQAVRRYPSISPHVTDYLRHSRRKGVKIGPQLLEHPFYKLSKRERQLFFLIAAGKKIETCAAEMNIAQKTASNLREKLMKKFNVKSGIDLIWKAFEIGLIDLAPQ
jgi:two-component system uhpT operon response regulator UhpA